MSNLSKMFTEGIKREIKNPISEISEIPPEQIKNDVSFLGDLKIDSMMALEVVASIEKKYKVVIPEERNRNLFCTFCD